MIDTKEPEKPNYELHRSEYGQFEFEQLIDRAVWLEARVAELERERDHYKKYSIRSLEEKSATEITGTMNPKKLGEFS